VIVTFDDCDALLLWLWFTAGVNEYVVPDGLLDKFVSLWFLLPLSALFSAVPELVFGLSAVSLDCFLSVSPFSEIDLFLSISRAKGNGLSDHDPAGSKAGWDGAVFERRRPTVASAVRGR